MQRRNFKRVFFSTCNNYQSIGSFHSEDMVELLNKATLPIEYPFPFPNDAPSAQDFQSIAFGDSAFKSRYFMLDTDWTFLNHGAFGACTRRSFQLAAEWRKYAEKQPLRFIDREFMPFLASNVRSLANFINTDVHDTVLIQNATYGLNAVIQSVPVDTNDVVFCFDTAYGSVKRMLRQKCNDSGATMHEIHVPLRTVSSESLVDLLESAIHQSQKRVALVVLDHVASNSGLRFPVENLVQTCRKHEIPVLIDGAHGLLNLPLDLDALQADFYVGNCHKWLSSPKGAAFLHVHPESLIPKQQIRPCIISHGYEKGFIDSFIWDGLRDTGAVLTLSDSIAEWEALGVDRVRSYMHELSYQGATLLADIWQTELLLSERPLLSSMVLVRLPLRKDREYSAKTIQDRLHLEFKIEIPVKTIQGQLYVRVSAHIYNRLKEYEELGRVFIHSLAIQGS